MKLKGGYLPKIAGRPSGEIIENPVSDKLIISLNQFGHYFEPLVNEGKTIDFGDPLAKATQSNGDIQIETGEKGIFLPSPVKGKIESIVKSDEKPEKLVIKVLDTTPEPLKTYLPERIKDETLREVLAERGLWSLLWSSASHNIPSLTSIEKPRAIVVNAVITEPFRTRGKVVLKDSWDLIIEGIKYMNRLLVDYGTIEIILTAIKDPVARMMYMDLAGWAWVKFRPVPLLYPIENERILNRLIREEVKGIKPDDKIWIINIQDIALIGKALAKGYPLYERIVALGGPGFPEPKHVRVRVGTPLKEVIKDQIDPEKVCILRGGLFLGELISDIETESINFDDDGFFFLPRIKKREMLSFLKPGFRRVSYLPVFMSSVFGAADSDITNSLRGELRPCIACGSCELVCPVGLFPNLIHRHLYSGDIDEADKLRVDLCVDCNLCTYICPSKIELQKQFHEAKVQLEEEKNLTT